MASTASYWTTTVEPTRVYVRINPDPNYAYYTIFVRLTSDTSNQTYYKNHRVTEQGTIIEITGLSPNTSYTMNVGYNNTGNLSVEEWLGAETFSTPAQTNKVTINYHANGGSGAPSSQTVTTTDGTDSIRVTLRSTEPTRSGYTFLGWASYSTATTPTYYAGSRYYFDGSPGGTTYTLYAVWSKNAAYYVKIVYNANGGSGAPSSQTVSNTGSVVAVTLRTTEPTRSGYTFLGWSTSSDATTGTYLPGSTYNFTGSTSTTTYTLYAVWLQDEYGVRITYVPIDDTGLAGAKTYYDTDENVAVTMPTVSKDGHKFLGWSTDLSATSADYLPGETYNFAGVLNGLEQYVLYAVFAALYYIKITYNANGGTGEPDTEQFSDTDEAITVTISSTMPTRDGYTFVGWSFDRTATSADWLAGGVYFNWKGSTDVATATLYAVWSRNTRFGGVWIKDKYYVPWVFNNGWQKYAAYVYNNGWKATKDK